MTGVVEEKKEQNAFYQSPTLSILYVTDDVVRTSVPAEGGAEDNNDWWS